jgi:hypothetical protein
MTNVTVAFRNFVKSSKNQSFTHTTVKLTDKLNHTYLMCCFFLNWARLHVSAVYISHHQVGTGSQKNSKKTGEASPNKQICMLVYRLTQHFSDKKHATELSHLMLYVGEWSLGWDSHKTHNTLSVGRRYNFSTLSLVVHTVTIRFKELKCVISV